MDYMYSITFYTHQPGCFVFLPVFLALLWNFVLVSTLALQLPFTFAFGTITPLRSVLRNR